MDKFDLIFQMRNQHQAEEQKKQQDEMKSKSGGSGPIRKPRRR